jgi:nucleotide-binding universal stress UspA family protein
MPASIETIVAATDFSEPAEVGLAWAAQASRTHGARLLVVHAVAPPMPVADFAAPPLTVDQELRDAAKKRLEALLEAEPLAGVGSRGGPPGRPPSQAVLDVADERGADLVVVGTRGLTGFRHMLLGSTAERIVQRAQAPVLSVHPGDPRPTHPPRTILVPTDFSEDAGAALTAARECLGPAPGDPRDPPPRLPRPRRVPLLRAVLDLRQALRGGLPALLRTAGRARRAAPGAPGGGPRGGGGVRAGHPGRGDRAPRPKTCGADLIAMGTHGRSGVAHLLLGSTAERVVQHAKCPVLTVRQPEDWPTQTHTVFTFTNSRIPKAESSRP